MRSMRAEGKDRVMEREKIRKAGSVIGTLFAVTCLIIQFSDANVVQSSWIYLLAYLGIYHIFKSRVIDIGEELSITRGFPVSLSVITIRFLYAALFCYAWQMFRFTGTAEEQTWAAGELRPLLHKLAKTGRDAIFPAHHTASSDTRSNSAS